MKYISKSITEYLLKDIDQQLKIMGIGQKMIFMVESMPEQLILHVAERMSEGLVYRNDVDLNIKIARVLTDQWCHESIKKAKDSQWYTSYNNLAYYRNEPVLADKRNIVILFGSDLVTDAGSLADFKLCNVKLVWEEGMGGNFIGWLTDLHHSNRIDVANIRDLLPFDGVLRAVMNQGRGDLFSISKWLENLNLTHCDNVNSAFDTALSNLDYFDLPNLRSFGREARSKRFEHYIYNAIDFFSYTMFLDRTKKRSALKAIDGVSESIIKGEGDWEYLDSEEVKCFYDSKEDLFDGLKSYIETGNKENKEKLAGIDFVFILDKILGFKKQIEKKSSIKRLSGSPVEMILTALWDSFYQFARSRDFGTIETINSITIVGDVFKHDLEWDNSDGSYSNEDIQNLAFIELNKLIGGLDDFVLKHIMLKNISDSDIQMSCSLINENLVAQYAKSAMSLFQFRIIVSSENSSNKQVLQYAWKLPSHHSYRLASDLISTVAEQYQISKDVSILPFFNISYFEEILKTTANEELRRVFQHGIRDIASEGKMMHNMLTKTWVEHDDILLPSLRKLGGVYQRFIEEANKKGLIASLIDNDVWFSLRRTYEETLSQISSNKEFLSSPMKGMLMRAFLIIRSRGDGSDAWFGHCYEHSAIITVLHPSLLEMLVSQFVYQASCFNYAFHNEIEKRDSAFKKHIWQSYLDLSMIKSPINCMLVDEGKNLDTRVYGHELIHKIGEVKNVDEMLSTKFLLGLNEDAIDEFDEVSDTEMFSEGRESVLLKNLMLDYFKIHPHSRDGLSIAFYRNQDIQPIIAAIHSYLMTLSKYKDSNNDPIIGEKRPLYRIQISIFTESADDSNIAKWIQLWKERWEAAKLGSRHRFYQYCRFSVSHRLIKQDDDESFLTMIKRNFSSDICFLYNITSSKNSADEFLSVQEMDIRPYNLKYPILEKTMATIENPADTLKRYRIVSNRQFSLSSELTRYMHSIKIRIPTKGSVVRGSGSLEPWKHVLKEIHEKSEWVVCIDPSIDDDLIRESGRVLDQKREIIGFGSGVGASGEENYTVSIHHFSLNDISVRLKYVVKNLIADSNWTDNDYQDIANGIIRIASNLSGLSLVRATGISDQYIRDFMAYALARKIFENEQEKDLICDNLVALDAYRHWFDFAENKTRPDLLRIVANINDEGKINLDLHLVECKMGKKSEALLTAARNQINNGLAVLVDSLKPNIERIDDDKPDRRYWWMQLHRLITAKAKISSYRQEELIEALERLAEGDFVVKWHASVFAFWIDEEGDELKVSGYWNNELTESGKVNVVTIAKNCIKNLALDKNVYALDLSNISGDSLETENIMQSIEDVDVIPDSKDDVDLELMESVDWWEEDEELDDDPPPWSDDIPMEEPVQELILQQDEEEDQSANDTADEVDIAKLRSKRVLLGKTSGGQEVYWEFGHEDIANRHMVIFGTSGMGKTYAIQCILAELARQEQNSVIIDYTDGFTPNNIEPAVKSIIPDQAQTFICDKPLPINPFKAMVSRQGDQEFVESSVAIAKRISSIFKSVYDLGSQQLPFVIEVIQSGIETHGDKFSFDLMLEMFSEYLDDSLFSRNTVTTTTTKLKPFITSRPFMADANEIGWKELYSDGNNRCPVFQFHMVDKQSSRAIIEFVLWDLYNYVSTYGDKNKPKVVVLDEIQNLDLDEDAPVSKYFTEGRKHGLSLIAATQTVKGVGGVSDAKVSRLFQAEMKLFFKPTENEMREHAQLLNNAITEIPVREWITRLSSLRKGECWVLGRHLNERTGKLELRAQKVVISSLEERGFYAE